MMRWALRPNILRSHDRDMELYPQDEKPPDTSYFATLLALKELKYLKIAIFRGPIYQVITNRLLLLWLCTIVLAPGDTF